MSHPRISLSPDFAKLQNEGFDIEVRGGYFVVHHVPFLGKDGELQFGDLRINLRMAGNEIAPPTVHTAYWWKERPCLESGEVVPSLGDIRENADFGNGLIPCIMFSLYPDNGMYKSYYDKAINYYNTIAGPALHKFPNALRQVEAKLVVPDEESSLKYIDTNSSKSNLNHLNQLFKKQTVAIVGIGGTGAYLLDYLAKLDLKEIRLYDADEFNSHNAFRAPGAPSTEALAARISKCDYFATIYSNMNTAIVSHVEMIGEKNIEELYDCDVVFICVDSNTSRNFITRRLADNGVTFIDSGMGLYSTDNSVGGSVRATTGFSDHYDHLKDAFGETELDNEDDPYKHNIQIAELNSLAAVMAIIKWKQMLGFYQNFDEDGLNKIFNVSAFSCQ